MLTKSSHGAQTVEGRCTPAEKMGTVPQVLGRGPLLRNGSGPRTAGLAMLCSISRRIWDRKLREVSTGPLVLKGGVAARAQVHLGSDLPRQRLHCMHAMYSRSPRASRPGILGGADSLSESPGARRLRYLRSRNISPSLQGTLRGVSGCRKRQDLPLGTLSPSAVRESPNSPFDPHSSCRNKLLRPSGCRPGWRWGHWRYLLSRGKRHTRGNAL